MTRLDRNIPAQALLAEWQDVPRKEGEALVRELARLGGARRGRGRGRGSPGGSS